ncbi:MAG: multicopper oxidase domain-containing protein [Devosia sp.]|uniref:multicopper oxidase domain-containing protein n=1 Tax=Devosia sp. TaxID=1871048 RepID=UPI001AD37CA7|nr:multicopper oxidase domain-containing protein [Devosia sp.]MBN9310331.1 multicopper oxidase domain-containing protein [Devosia sp.]MBN9317221.1 multicopper oxidase domain-containing protein [Devosia sp.]
MSSDDTAIEPVTRRGLLIGGLLAAGGAAGFATVAAAQTDHIVHAADATPAFAPDPYAAPSANAGPHGAMMTVGEVDHARNGFDPSAIVSTWDTGTLSTTAEGKPLRIFEVEAMDKEIEIAPGVMFPAWTYNGRVPGPAFRAKEGERLRFVFKNFGSHPHSMHFHGIHSARMDGVPGAGLVSPGEEFVYEFDARPFGCHLYHCHAVPLKRHMHKGMYGAFVIDPDPERHPQFEAQAKSRLLGTPENAEWQELVMVMNAFDTNFDGENEFYAVNSIPHAYGNRPIRIDKSRPVRIYLVNVTEFDPINSFHLHANFFDYYDTGTSLTPSLRSDIITQCQAQRGILEFSYADHEPGMYMFHAHQSEFTELGWMGVFDVVESPL